MNKKSKQLITKLAVYGTLAYTAASCVIGIGGFGIRLNTLIVNELGYIRYAAAVMAVWLIYILGSRKKLLSQWFYAALTIVFISAALSTIQPGAFGSVSASIVRGIWGPTDAARKLFVWALAAAFLILPNTHDIKFSGIKEKLSGRLKPELRNKFNIPAPAAAPYTGAMVYPGKPLPLAYFEDLLADKAFMRNKYLIPIGVKEDGRPLYVELGDKYPQFLVAGTTGSGKTVFLQSFVVALAAKNVPADLQLILIDGVQRGLKPLAVLPHVIHDGVLFEEPDVVKALRYAYNSLKERIREDVCTPKIVTIIDDIDDFFAGEMGAEIQKFTTYIVKKGRQFGVHMVIGSQRPSGDLVSPHTLAMLKRVCLQVELPKYSDNIIQKPDGAGLKGEGDLLFLDAGRLIHARGFYLDEKEQHEATDIAAQIAGMYPPALRIFRADAADRNATGAGEDDGIDLFIPNKKEGKVLNFHSYAGMTGRNGGMEHGTAEYTGIQRLHENVIPLERNGMEQEYSAGMDENMPDKGAGGTAERNGTVIDKINELQGQGMTWDDISAEMGIPKTSLYRMYKKVVKQAAAE